MIVTRHRDREVVYTPGKVEETELFGLNEAGSFLVYIRIVDLFIRRCRAIQFGTTKTAAFLRSLRK
ncbi:MAG: hypothetical protein MUP22_12645 [Desulfobacterales bacterium]|nr:hypothetical protein [Desulfobacterales bacterium]